MEINIKKIEKEVDETFDCIPLPHKVKDIAIWHVLTVLEDSLRMLFTRWVEKEPHDIEAFTDESKYALRHCLDRINKSDLIDEKIPLPLKSNPDAYVKAHALYAGAVEFAQFSRMVGSIYSGRAQLIVGGGEYVLEYEQPFEPKYGALELLDQGQEEDFDISTLLYHALNGSRSPSEIESAICDSARVKSGRVHYVYDVNLAYTLAQDVPQRPVLIPAEFNFPWGNAHDTLVLINSLHLRCLYHLLAVNLTAMRLRLRGGSEASLLLSLSEKDLVRDLSYLADIGDDKIEKFVRHLTYGYKSKTPDPALQPLILTRGGLLLLPCTHIITSNSQRNILSLFARISAPDFDRQSEHFEPKMIDELLPQLRDWPCKVANRELIIDGQKEEFDIIVCDFESRTVLIFELRWMVQPGDPREVANRYDVCDSKVEQTNRKIAFVEKNIKEVIRRIFDSEQSEIQFSSWKVRGVVVIQGFGGHISARREVPVITSEVLKLGLTGFSSAAKLYEWASALNWLPQEELHFCITSENVKTQSHVLRHPGIFLKVNNNDYLEYVKATISEA